MFYINSIYYFLVFGSDEALTVPLQWGVSANTDNHIIFTYVISQTINNKKVDILQKNIKIDRFSHNLTYYVHGTEVDLPEMPSQINKGSILIPTLISFQKMRVCEGIGALDKTFLFSSESLKNTCGVWRDKKCTLLSKSKRCTSCQRSRKSIKNKFYSTENSKKQKINIKFKFADRNGVFIMKKQLAREKRLRRRAQKEVKVLNAALQKCHDRISAMKEETFDRICKLHKINDTQKMTMKEILNCSKRKPKGQRYSEEWLMMCMLLNIRSPSTYEFLRRNNIIPLPCMRTVRRYFSLIDTKCGFDNKFQTLFKKHLQSKKPIKKHGVLVLDEINLRKSVTVSSKNLTFSGLTDFGDDGPKAENIIKLPTA